MTKVTLRLQNHWRMANAGVGIVQRDLTSAEIRCNPLLGRRLGWQYNRRQYSGEHSNSITLVFIQEFII